MKNLAAALIKAQLEMDPLRKDAKNPAFGKDSKYASLAGVQEVALPALAKYEVAVMQSVSTEWNENAVLVKVGCTLFHAPSGECVVNEIALKPVKTDPQSIGSAITYGRRYLLLVMAGLAPEDDDGNEASGKVASKPVQAQTSTPVAQHRQPEATATPSNGNGAAKSAAFKRFMAEGATLFGGEWDGARHWIIESYTKKTTPDKVRTSANELTDAELSTLADSLKKNTEWFKAEWSKQPKQTPVAA